MRKILFCAFFSMILFAIGPGCKAKEGCGMEKYEANMENPKKGKSTLWSKKQTKKKKR